MALPDVMNPTNAPPPVIVPLGEGADAKTIGELLCGGAAVKGPVTLANVCDYSQCGLRRKQRGPRRARQLHPVDRPEVTSALASLGETGAEVLLIPSSDTRRVVEEMLPNLPKEVGGPITTISRGLSWTAIGLNQDPEPNIRFVVQGKDAESTKP